MAWVTVELYSTFMKVTGELEVPDRLSDAVNRYGDYLELRSAVAEPLATNYPVLSRQAKSTAVAKGAIALVTPLGETSRGDGAHWRETAPTTVAINCTAFSLLAEVHLKSGYSLRDHLDRFGGEFISLTNFSALWVPSSDTQTHALQRPFALLNPAAILSYSVP